MGWRVSISNEHSIPYVQKAQNTQKSQTKEPFGHIGNRVEKVKSLDGINQEEPIPIDRTQINYSEPSTQYPENEQKPPNGIRGWAMESPIIGKAEILYDPKEPDQVVCDGKTYTTAEIEKLKGLDRESLLVVHNVKTIFQGAVL